MTPELCELGDALTPRELEVLELLLQGWPNKAIAVMLAISQRTEEVHRRVIMIKTGARNAVQLGAWATVMVERSFGVGEQVYVIRGRYADCRAVIEAVYSREGLQVYGVRVLDYANAVIEVRAHELGKVLKSRGVS